MFVLLAYSLLSYLSLSAHNAWMVAWDEPVAYIGLLLQCALYISYIGRPARSSKFLQQAVHPMVKPPRTQVTVQAL